MRRAVVLVVATAALPLIASSTAATAASGRTPSTARAGTTVSVQARHWIAHERAAFRAAGAVVVGSVGNSATSPTLVPVGVLKGTSPDVIDARSVDSPAAMGITARVASTGRALWSKTLPASTFSSTAVLPERLGAAGARGVLVVTATETFDFGPATETVTLMALTGRTGHLLWKQTLTGTYNGEAETSIPTFCGMMHAAKGPDSSALVTESTINAMGTLVTTTPELVSDIDGSMQQPGSISESTVVADVPTFQPIPDISGDGLDDLLIVKPGDAGTLTAEDSFGVQLWSENMPGGDVDPTVTPVGSFSQAGTTDLAVVGRSAAQDSPTTVSLVQGASDAVLWTRPADGYVAIRKAGTSLVPAVQLYSESGGTTASSDTATLEVMAVTPGNQVLYDRATTVATPIATNEHFSRYFVTYQALGDVQPDGSVDGLVSLEALSVATKGTSKTLTGVVNGRTGAFHEVTANASADGSLHHGKGTDLLNLTLASGKLSIVGISGVSRTRYYKRVVTAMPSSTAASIDGVRITGHACSDLTLSSRGAHHDAAAVLTARGAVLWRVVYPPAQVTGGTVTRYATPKHFCV